MLKRMVSFWMVAAALLLLSNVMVAQERYGGSPVAKEHGYQHGYRDGLRQGRTDLSRGVADNFETEDYRRGDLGYKEYMGERDDFQNGYHEGYKAGYEDGYNGKPIRRDIYGLNDKYDPDQNPRSEVDAPDYEKWHYTDVAGDVGYRDGLQAGYNDLSKSKEFRPEKHESYEDGHHGYRKAYGNKDLYKEEYRKAFIRGYEDAYNPKHR